MSFWDKVLILLLVSFICFVLSLFVLWVWGSYTIVGLIGAAIVRVFSVVKSEEAQGFLDFFGRIFKGGLTAGSWVIISFVISGGLVFASCIAFLATIGNIIWPLFILDTIVDLIVTRIQTNILTRKENIVLATRAEYIGGYPKLPHSRFVYIFLEGTRENPIVSILLPGLKGARFSIPVIDMTKATGLESDKYGSGGLAIFLTSVSSTVWRGRRIHFNIEYTERGRKQTVELGSFLRGNEEIHNWKNFLVCTQAEADTGEKPFGHWKSLPQEA